MKRTRPDESGGVRGRRGPREGVDGGPKVYIEFSSKIHTHSLAQQKSKQVLNIFVADDKIPAAVFCSHEHFPLLLFFLFF